MAAENVQDLIDEADGDVIGMLRNAQTGAYVYPVVPHEYTNWQREQQASRTAAVLYDQSHHMDNTFIRGRDALRLIRDTAINSVTNFEVGRAKQYVAVTPDGYVVGDGILTRDAAEEYTYVGRAPASDWLLFHGETGGYDVEVRRDPRSPMRPLGKAVSRELWRFEIQGPAAWEVVEAVNGAPIVAPEFFRMGSIRIGGREYPTLRHGMAGEPGLEIWGPYETYHEVRDAILAAGAPHGLEPVGSRAYNSNTAESGWIPSPLPAIYSGDGMLRRYREWLPATSYEGVNAIAGSFVPPSIEDYYSRPWDLGYGGFIRTDHDFIGREAIERLDPTVQRKKVTLEWDVETTRRILGSVLDDEPYKFLDLPTAGYAPTSFDSVLDERGDIVGGSMYTAFSSNERRYLSLAAVDHDVRIGDTVEVVWGEPDGGTRKTTVQPHRQIAVRAIVSPAPYAAVACKDYHRGWRTGAN
jgi:vanillate/3-O-methylgallate O-demethylase